MNANYVRKNLREAQKFLKDEECYAFRNIFDRSYFLTTEKGINDSKVFSFAKNDSNLKMARLIFRYKNNLDELFDVKQDPSYAGTPIPSIIASPHTNPKKAGGGGLITGINDDLSIYQYKNI
jgi:hypothetical protein